MYLTKIVLDNWKSCASGVLEFPRPVPGRNVILIGARNGYGKTSIFEAIVLGLFGREGLNQVARAPFEQEASSRPGISYDHFLRSALHRREGVEGRRTASVALHFDSDVQEPMTLRRVWHFAADGTHRPADEELRVYIGREERPEGPSRNEDEGDWRRMFVARNLLPHTLASFFLFDGEQVQALAKRDMAAQVRRGIEELLGLHVLNELKADLRAFAHNQRSTAGGKADTKNAERVFNEIAVFEHNIIKEKEQLAADEPEPERLKARREFLTGELSGLGVGGGDSVTKDRHEEHARVKAALRVDREKLFELITAKLAAAVAGRKLRDRARARLIAEAAREDWEGQRRQGTAKEEHYVAAVTAALGALDIGIDDARRLLVETVLREEWTKLWYPPPTDCAPDFRHDYARGLDRENVIRRLEQLGALSSSQLQELTNEIARGEATERRMRNEIAQLEGISPKVQATARELSELNPAIDRLVASCGQVKRALEGNEAMLRPKRQEYARLVQSQTQAQPKLKIAERADRVADVVEDIVKAAVPDQVGRVGAAMTVAYRAMAHKKIVEKVSIDEDCEVTMLTATGRDVRELDASAGEQQIFAQALIAAIASVSERSFPIVIDTPLGRLDDQHRNGVLQHFTDRPGQVFLLSTDTEVVGPHLDVVKPRLLSTWHIVHEQKGDYSASRPERGYFPGSGA